MSVDLGFSDRIYGLGVGMFYVTYVLFEIPGAIIVERWSARIFEKRKQEHIERGYQIEDERPIPVNGFCSFIVVRELPVSDTLSEFVAEAPQPKPRRPARVDSRRENAKSSKTTRLGRRYFVDMETNRPQTTKGISPETSLDSNLEAFRNELRKASEVVIRLYQKLSEAGITPAKSRMQIASLFDEALPDEPQPMDKILELIEENIFANSTLYLSPRFFGYINGGGNQAAVIGEMLTSAVNQICAKWHFSPAASEVELRVIRWIAEFIGYPVEAEGCLLSGGSAGNMVGLAAARQHKAQFDAASLGMGLGPPLTAYVSEQGHASLDKCMGLLGMGRNQVRKVAVRDDFTIDVERLAQQIADDRRNGYQPICVVGNAGATNTGAVDPLNALADLCRDEGLWFHVDAAYGGPAARTDIAGKLFLGLARADSVVVNAHKWLFVPVEASCVLVRKPRALLDTFQIAADYLEENDKNGGSYEGFVDFKDYGPQLSRSFRALKVWMTFKAYGAKRLRAAITSNIEIMRYLADRIDESKDFVRLAPAPLSVVCFQYRTTDSSRHGDQKYLDDLNRRLLDASEKDGRVFLSGTTIHGKKALRACSVNHRLQREHVDFLLDVTREIGRSLASR